MAEVDAPVEIVVVDNCPDGSARLAVQNASVRATYLHEARPGVANARNAGIRGGSGAYVLFIDDDEVPELGWLSHMTKMAQAGHPAVFGPVISDFEEQPPEHLRPILESVFSRDLKEPTGSDVSSRRAYLGTGNSLFNRVRCFDRADPFETRFNGGGEDIWLLRELVESKGIPLVWCKEASVRELVPAARMNAAYLRSRRFQGGQLRCIVEAGGRNWGAVILWMGVGILQTAAYGSIAAIFLPFDKNRSARLSTRMAAGVGKILWWIGAKG